MDIHKTRRPLFALILFFITARAVFIALACSLARVPDDRDDQLHLCGADEVVSLRMRMLRRVSGALEIGGF
jgi:hypothetical protein